LRRSRQIQLMLKLHLTTKNGLRVHHSSTMIIR
jgi:hypothetical protein